MRSEWPKFDMARFKGAMKNMSSPKLLRKISIASKQRPFRVAILGQNGVGKSALTVRFLTRRFIGDYDPLLEKIYTCNRCQDGESIIWEVLDTAAQEENSRLEENIKWADAFILMYSVTDRCSFNECSRLKFLINSYCKRQRKTSVVVMDTGSTSPVVAMVGNQNDRIHDRMITEQEGLKRAKELNCSSFHEISVRESIDSVMKLFEELFLLARKPKKFRPVLHKQSSLPASLSNEPLPTVPEVGSMTLSRRRKAVLTIS